jgi:putative addiction module component (TIGR02574 family)
MKAETDDLLERALKLPPEARAALAGHLIDSLDETVDEGVEDAWAMEVAQRLKGLREGRVKLVSWSEARRRIDGK